jgi:hypothetical protein
VQAENSGELPNRDTSPLVVAGLPVTRKRSHERSEMLTVIPAYGFDGVAGRRANDRIALQRR